MKRREFFALLAAIPAGVALLAKKKEPEAVFGEWWGVEMIENDRLSREYIERLADLAQRSNIAPYRGNYHIITHRGEYVVPAKRPRRDIRFTARSNP